MSKIDDVGELMEVLRAPDSGLSRLARVVASGELRGYLETRQNLDRSLRREIGALLERWRERPKLALFALRFRLTNDPLELVPGVAVRSPAEIAPLVAPGAAKREAVLRALRGLIGDGRLGEWLGVFEPDGGEGAIETAEAARRDFPKETDLPLHAVLWRLAPELGFPVGGSWLKTPKELADWIERDADHRGRGLALYERGWIPTWLAAIGVLRYPGQLIEPLPRDLLPGARAEVLLGLLDPKRRPPEIGVRPGSIKIGRLAPDTVAERTVVVTARGGYIWGACELQGDAAGMRVEPLSFEGTPVELRLSVDSTGMPSSTSANATLAVSCFNGRSEQRLRVPVRYRVRVPLAPGIARSILAGGIVGAVMAFLRLLAGSTLSGKGAANEPLDWVSLEWVEAVFARSFSEFFGLVLLSLALLGTLVGIGVYLAKVCGR